MDDNFKDLIIQALKNEDKGIFNDPRGLESILRDNANPKGKYHSEIQLLRTLLDAGFYKEFYGNYGQNNDLKRNSFIQQLHKRYSLDKDLISDMLDLLFLVIWGVMPKHQLQPTYPSPSVNNKSPTKAKVLLCTGILTIAGIIILLIFLKPFKTNQPLGPVLSTETALESDAGEITTINPLVETTLKDDADEIRQLETVEEPESSSLNPLEETSWIYDDGEIVRKLEYKTKPEVHIYVIKGGETIVDVSGTYNLEDDTLTVVYENETGYREEYKYKYYVTNIVNSDNEEMIFKLQY